MSRALFLFWRRNAGAEPVGGGSFLGFYAAALPVHRSIASEGALCRHAPDAQSEPHHRKIRSCVNRPVKLYGCLLCASSLLDSYRVVGATSFDASLLNS